MQKKHYESPSCQNSLDSADSQRWEDPLSVALGRKETRGRLRGVGYGAQWKTYLPESPELAKIRRKSRKEEIKLDFVKNVEEQVAIALQRMGLGLAPLHPHTPPPSETARQSSNDIAEGSAHGSPRLVDDITVSIVGPTNRMNSTGLAN